MPDSPTKRAEKVPGVISDKALHHLGQTRSAIQADHALLTPDTYVRAPLPGMERASAIVHTAPAMGASFAQYTAEIETGGSLGPTDSQRFLFVLEGKAEVQASGQRHELTEGGFAYLPASQPSGFCAMEAVRVAVIEKPYQLFDGTPTGSSGPTKTAQAKTRRPAVLIGQERSIAPRPFMGDPSLIVRALLPDDPTFDFAVNTMTYAPGACLPMVESHIMEHGLLMLEGEGIYRLGQHWYPVAAGDFIWMAPYCLQWFGALGKVPAKYLIYKPWNRHPLS